MAGVYGVWVQPIENATTAANVQKYGEVMDVLAEYDMDEATASKQFCDGQTSITPPRYANDEMGMIFTYDRQTAELFSSYLRDEVATRISAGELVLSQPPAWLGNVDAVFSIGEQARTIGEAVLLLRDQMAISADVTDSQIRAQIVAYMGETGIMDASLDDIMEYIADRARWA